MSLVLGVPAGERVAFSARLPSAEMPPVAAFVIWTASSVRLPAEWITPLLLA